MMKGMLCLALLCSLCGCVHESEEKSASDGLLRVMRMYMQNHSEWNTFYMIAARPLTGEVERDSGGWLLTAGDTLSYFGRKYKPEGFMQIGGQRVLFIGRTPFSLPVDTSLSVGWVNRVDVGSMKIRVGGKRALYLKDFAKELTASDSTWHIRLNRTGHLFYEGIYLYYKDGRLIYNDRADSLFLYRYSPTVTFSVPSRSINRQF